MTEYSSEIHVQTVLVNTMPLINTDIHGLSPYSTITTENCDEYVQFVNFLSPTPWSLQHLLVNTTHCNHIFHILLSFLTLCRDNKCIMKNKYYQENTLYFPSLDLTS